MPLLTAWLPNLTRLLHNAAGYAGYSLTLEGPQFKGVELYVVIIDKKGLFSYQLIVSLISKVNRRTYVNTKALPTVGRWGGGP